MYEENVCSKNPLIAYSRKIPFERIDAVNVFGILGILLYL